ncbi:peptide deformylase [Carboxylicivirga sp. M1479]|uniref:peptide deformylase n=1 Tax=Carboxylicivirga sp. M1479 TaxID=2594476 RepID=UPI0011776B79|nr:peptide deformylase [Carboxylicivirga sp. M1479]TRX66362.1 peptide deformylase [Carboxylicivirga sp. M1479]
MIFPIAVYGHQVLRKKATKISANYPHLNEFLKDLWATLYRTDGIGLAAPQVGKSIRLFLIDLDVFKDEYPELKGFKKVFINAKLELLESPNKSFSEGCLSLPGIHQTIKRPDKIRIHYKDENFIEHTEEYEGFVARVIQHEYDHLEGHLFIDKLPRLKRIFVKLYVGLVKKRFSNAAYKTVSS